MKLSENTANVVRLRRSHRRAQKLNQRRNLMRTVAILILLLFLSVFVLSIGSVALAFGVYYSYARNLPRPAEITKVHEQFETTRIYDRSGKTVLYEVVDPNGDRQSVALSAIPKDLVNATIAIEDKSFYTNPGFDIRGIARAMWISLQNGQVQGGSTITQQLVKNTLIPVAERTAFSQDRKIKEVILAAEVSRLYSKEQILEWYLNTNFYGNLAYGVDAAAKVYFGKHVQDLTLGEAAMLAAIPQNPQLNPLDDPVAASQRQAVVLESMVSLGYITDAQAKKVLTQPIIIQPPTERYDIIAPHFSLYARRQAEQILNAQGLDGTGLVLGGGLKIYTTLDLDLQYQVECASKAYVQRLSTGNPTASPNTTNGQPCTAAQYLPAPPGFALNKPRNVTNAATVTIRPNTGEILSMTGSIDYFNVGIQGNYNAALGQRQPGSAFKPFLYVTAFAANSNRYTPATMVLDVPTAFNNGTYTPKNEDDQFHGPMSVRTALANSYNIPAVRVIADVTVAQVIRTARQLGLSSLNARQEEYGLALALGSGEVSLLDLSYGYSVFANLGIMAGTPTPNQRPGFRSLDPVSILRIEDKDGHILWQFDEKQQTFGKQNLLRDALAYLINNILEDNQARLPAFGKGNALELSRPAAVKTGTTNDNRDAWTVGYTPQLVTGVWVGNNNNAGMGDDLTGSTGAAPIWHAIMEYYHARDKLPVQDWARPTTIKEQRVCRLSGLLPTPACDTVNEIFLVDDTVNTIPTQPDIYWKRIPINKSNGLRATSNTPADLITTVQYFDPPPEALDWAKAAKWQLPPTQYDTIGNNAQRAATAGNILDPKSAGRVRGVVSVKGKLSTTDVVSYFLEYGAGLNPSQWVSISGADANARGQNVVLGKWDTSNLDGLYTLRLSMTLKNGLSELDTTPVTVDNQAPTVELTAPQPNLEISTATSTITIQAKATDNLEVASVEFYANGQLIKRLTQEPYKVDWTIDKTGLVDLYALAYDSAGNQTRSQSIQITINP